MLAYCSGACRVEAWRFRRLLSGLSAGRYATVRDRVEAMAALAEAGAP